MTHTLPILIVGAGPTGLVAAIELARRDLPVRIIEANESPLLASRAKGLQPRTLEIFDDLGVIDEIIAQGAAFPRWRSYDRDRLRWEKSVYELLGRDEPMPTPDRPYPSTWMIPQWATEEILRRRLAASGITIEFGVTFLGVAQNADGVTATVRLGDRVDQIRCRYLVGADSARSQVRKALQIPFAGETKEDERYIIADVKAVALGNDVWLNWSIDGDAVRRISMCPLPQSDYFQFVAPLVAGEEEPELSLATLQRLFEERTGRTDVALSDARWIVSHRPNVRLAERFRSGAVFLVGDAAHSPPTSPGQGLNISIQDAYNLGWKLGAAMSGAPDALLDSYEAERRPIAAGVLGVLASQLVTSGMSLEEAERRQQDIRRDIFNLDHNYRDSPLSCERRARPGRVQAGDRAPDGPVRDAAGVQRRLFDLFRGTHATVLLFDVIDSLSWRSSHAAWNIEIRVVHVRAEDAPTLPSLHDIYDVSPDIPTLFVIRPDGFVGMCTDHDFDQALTNWLMTSVGPR